MCENEQISLLDFLITEHLATVDAAHQKCDAAGGAASGASRGAAHVDAAPPNTPRRAPRRRTLSRPLKNHKKNTFVETPRFINLRVLLKMPLVSPSVCNFS